MFLCIFHFNNKKIFLLLSSELDAGMTWLDGLFQPLYCWLGFDQIEIAKNICLKNPSKETEKRKKSLYLLRLDKMTFSGPFQP